MTERRRLAILLLAVAGSMVAHTVGYGLAGTEDSLHGYLGPAAWLVLPAGLGGLIWLGVRAARTADVSVCASQLLRWQIAVFALQEITERVAVGAPLTGLVADGVVLGLAAQLVVAPLLAWLAGRVGAVARRFVDTDPVPPVVPLRVDPPIVPARPAGRIDRRSPATRRGPPSFVPALR